MTMSRWYLDFFTFPESNALQWCNDIHVKVNEKCALQLQLYMTLVSCFYSIMWITSLASSVRVAGSLA